MEKDQLDRSVIKEINRAGWNKAAHYFYGGTALPIYGPLAPTEDDLKLLDPISGKRILELGCGSGHSLLYLSEHEAVELWGLDLSETQIDIMINVGNAKKLPVCFGLWVQHILWW